MLSADWVFKLHWITPLLSAWLKLSRRVRLSVVAVTLVTAGLVAASAYALGTKESARTTRPIVPAGPLQTPSLTTHLPALTSANLYELTQAFDDLAINQQRENFSLSFTTDWRAFAAFTNQLANSNLAPRSYHLHWGQPDPESMSDQQQIKMDLQLSPGIFKGHSAPAITLAHKNESHTVPTELDSNCETAAFPVIIVQAAWPSRGYIQILVDGRSERLTLNQMFQHKWQLLRIGSESVEFRWHTASPSCPQPGSFTVVI